MTLVDPVQVAETAATHRGMASSVAVPIRGRGRLSGGFREHSWAIQRFAPMPIPMKMFGILVLGAVLATAAPSEGAAGQDRRSDQLAARKGRMQGQLLPARVLEARIVPGMVRQGAQYIGFDFDSGTSIYTLKFLRNGNVIWVDVDGRSGQIIGRSGG